MRKSVTKIIDYNCNFDSDKEVGFINIDILCNKLSPQFLANDSTTHFKTYNINKIRNKDNEDPKTNTIREKKISIKYVITKSLKVSVLIIGFVEYSTSDL